jgi:hypothetical protein
MNPKFQVKWKHDVLALERQQKKHLDITGASIRRYNRRKLSLITRMRISATLKRRAPFIHGLHPFRSYLKRRV